QDLRKKVSESADVSLITSNPDFVIIDSSINIDFPAPPQSGISDAYIEAVCRAFSQLEHRCSLDQIKGYTAVKSSLRPDRRLQIAHEGSLMKALYRHVQTREWLIDAPGIKYYAITSKATDADRNALKTVATHSITDVGSKPEAAVDDLLCVFSGPELESALKKILF
ncbi:MAG TPA: Cfr10I/Bse634I family restriction endonuclease, partial [Alphaproteobacteria bacterium]|nr:Cfr10I/Bse634I family restriction endonuclease [Alphaproteobacteria bacterium]